MSVCFNCGNRATYQMGPRLFCLDCAEKMSRIAERQQQKQFLESIHRANMLNFILERAEGMSAGQPGFLGRFPVPQITSTTVRGDITLNNINSRSTVGVLNTGQLHGIQRIDVNISKLSGASQTDFAEALRVLTKEIASSPEISVELRSELIEQLHELSDQALLPPNQRKVGVIRAILMGLSSSLNAVSALATVWATWGDTIRSSFGL